ncbi:winged helix DNA-binding domain-containing protein [Flexivirga sp. ID2601S]|uniref:Winged helix DNA-binding domain-containing protein n=1 Tax=Flexivirga aerilata TaxID=1656889 RepID=A0A849AHA5_9MICO|nr:winged helix DNA-binding domain-containing protein [Flexivirga aerilata]NNG39769.1 winged helix DNA-binding domain-containing protein [Flexivirga aerilata]
MTTPRDFIARLRLVAQRLVGPAADTPADAMRWMTCSQAQDFRAARSAVALRAGTSVAEVEHAVNAGELVRSWPMRGTLHLVAAEDLAWMLSLNRDSMLRVRRRRHEELDIGQRDIAHATEVAVAALQGGGRLDRAGLFALWQQHGIATDGQRGIHLVQALALDAVIVLGPMSGKQQCFVLFDEWIPLSRKLTREQAVAEWAGRYFRSHGPATVADFRWWSGLLQRDLSPVWDEVRATLAEVTARDTTYFLDPATLDAWDALSAATQRPLLTPAFDEILLGYADRSPTLPPSAAGQVVPGGNGVFRPVLIDGGRAVATWQKPAKDVGDVSVSPLGGPLTARATRALPGLTRRYPFA